MKAKVLNYTINTIAIEIKLLLIKQQKAIN